MLRVHDPLEGVDADGAIVTGASVQAVPAAFRPVLDAAQAALAPGAASLYVYGSVATGTARPGHSDVDLFTVGLPADEAKRLARALSARFGGLCRGVEIGAAQAQDYAGPGDPAHGNRVFLRHYGAHLAGPDLARGLPRYAADAAAARGFNGDIAIAARRWRAELALTEPDRLARRLARKTLFAVAGLVSLHDRTWTTDRLRAANRWAELRPGLAAGLANLVDWGEGPARTPGTAELEAALDGVVQAVAREFEQRIGLWGEGERGRDAG